MASATASIPRFLLPQTAPIWRRLRVPGSASPSGRVLVRYASAGKGSKPIVLEKPERFNPPSHGARLARKTTPRHYGGELSAEETQAQKVKDYPGLMAPDGTWSHWFWHSRSFHLLITMSTLTGLAMFTFVQNFKHNSPFADMIPPWSDFLYHPITSGRVIVEVIRLNEAHNAANVQEKRKKRVDDVVKRSQYRKAHGLEDGDRLGGWTAKTDAEMLGPALPSSVGEEQAASAQGTPEAHEPRKKWLGIF